MFQQQSTWRRSSDSEETSKIQYYKLLKLKPMFIKLNVSSHGSEFKPQIINLSMVREITEGYKLSMRGLSPTEWCILKFIDDSELYVDSTLDELQSKISDEENKDIYVRVRGRASGLGPL
jgi:hypothetical protein